MSLLEVLLRKLPVTAGNKLNESGDIKQNSKGAGPQTQTTSLKILRKLYRVAVDCLV